MLTNFVLWPAMRTNISPRQLFRLKLLELIVITHHKLLELIIFLSFKSNKIGWEIVTSIFSWLFVNVLSGICSQSSGEGPKGRFFASDMPENHTSEKQRKNRKSMEKKKKEKRKKQWLHSYFYIVFLATLFWTKWTVDEGGLFDDYVFKNPARFTLGNNYC